MSTETTFNHSRLLNFLIDQIYEAYTIPELLIQRRGPKGFTNEFEICHPVEGSKRKFTMIGPEGARHPNESKFVKITKEKIIIEHSS